MRWMLPVFGFTTSDYERERERGLDYQEDLYSPFLLHFDVEKNHLPHDHRLHRRALRRGSRGS